MNTNATKDMRITDIANNIFVLVANFVASYVVLYLGMMIHWYYLQSFVPEHEGISFAGMFYAIPLLPIIYLFSGYRFLRPLPKWNFLLSSGLLLSFIMYVYLNIFDWYRFSTIGLFNFLPVLLPSLLMYFGLCLQMWRKTKTSRKEHTVNCNGL
jgi:hypothetical protein